MTPGLRDELDRPIRLERLRGVDGVGDELGQLDGLPFERPALVESREEE